MTKILSKIGPIYVLSYTKLETLRNYLDKNLKKNFIQKIKITVKFYILFVLKKNKKLKLYINYRKLNIIIVKSKYLLLYIREFQNYLARAK